MSINITQEKIDSLLEILAGIEHARWSNWQRYLHGKCERSSDGSLTIPEHLVTQWERQAATPYDNLSEKERESDREQVWRYLPVILDAFGIVTVPSGTKR